MSFAPEEIKPLIVEAFTDSAHPAYGQAATVDSRGFPQLRTVHFHYAKEWDALAFNTHVKSAKWGHLQKKPWLSGCFVDPVRLYQFRWESEVELVDPHSKEHDAFLTNMWLMMRPDVRKAYALDHDNTSNNLDQRRPNVSSIICRPFRWHIYQMNESNFMMGNSMIYTWKNKAWTGETVSLVTGSKKA